MALLKEDDFKKLLSSEISENIFLLYGEEKYLVSHYTDLLTKKVAPIINEFNFHLFDDDADISDICVAVNVMPFMSERNVVKIVDFDFNKFNKDDYDSFAKLLKNIPDTTVLIITMPTLDEKQAKNKEDDEEKGKKSFAKLKDYVTKHGVCVNFEHRAELKLEKTLCKWAKDGNAKMSELTASKLIEYVGTDLTSLHSEVEKLSAFANGEEITIEMIEKLVTKNLEAQIFSLFDFIIKGQSDKAMTTLSTLFFQNEAPIAIITILSNAYVDFYRAKIARESSIFPDNFAKELKYPSNRVWVLGNMLKKYSFVTTSAIRKSIEEITNVYERLVSVSTNPQTELEKLVAKLILFAKDKFDD